MKAEIMLVSATISGGAVGTRLNNCSTPQMIWESRLFSLNGMAAEVEEAQRVTSEFFHKYHEASWVAADLVPPAPTGAFVQYINNGTEELERFWTVDDYGMNYISAGSLGSGAVVVATLPHDRTGNFTEPSEAKATLFFTGKATSCTAHSEPLLPSASHGQPSAMRTVRIHPARTWQAWTAQLARLIAKMLRRLSPAARIPCL